MSQGDQKQPQQSAVSALPPELQAANASKEDRSLAMISLLLGLLSFVGPLVLYFMKKDQASKFVMYYIKQSLFFEVAVIVVLIVMVILSFIATFLTGGVMGCVCMPITMLVPLGSLVYMIIGVIQVNGGKDFEYYFIGPWVRKSM